MDKKEDFVVFVVWQCKTLQNHKAILSASNKGAMLYDVRTMETRKSSILMLIRI